MILFVLFLVSVSYANPIRQFFDGLARCAKAKDCTPLLSKTFMEDATLAIATKDGAQQFIRTVKHMNKFLLGAYQKYKNLRFTVDDANSGMTGQISVDAPHGSKERLTTVFRLSDLKRDHESYGMIERVTFNVDLRVLDGTEGIGEAFPAQKIEGLQMAVPVPDAPAPSKTEL